MLLEEGEVGPLGKVRLDGRRMTHLRKVLRVVVGQSIRAGILRGATGLLWVESLDAEAITLRFQADAEAEGESAWEPKIDLVLALPRPKVLSRVLRAAASFGVGRIDLINAWKVEKSYFDSPRLRPERLRADLISGCEQGAHTWLPDLELHPLFVDWIAALGPSSEEGVRIFADLGSRRSLVDLPGLERRAVVAIGPEGGWIEAERESLEAAGFLRASLGHAILAVPEAVTAALAQIELLQDHPAIRHP